MPDIRVVCKDCGEILAVAPGMDIGPGKCSHVWRISHSCNGRDRAVQILRALADSLQEPSQIAAVAEAIHLIARGE